MDITQVLSLLQEDDSVSVRSYSSECLETVYTTSDVHELLFDTLNNEVSF